MTNRFRLVSLVTLFLVLGTLLAACGGGGGGAAATSAPAAQATTAPAPAATAAGAATTAPAATSAPEATAAPAAGGGKAVTILSLWGGSEQEAFQKVLDGFTAKTGIKTQYEQARDFTTILNSRIAAGNPPMVAIVPRPGVMADLAKNGSIKPLMDLGLTDDMLKQSYNQAFIDLGMAEGKIYGVFAKANSKSTVWYKPNSFKDLGVEPPKDWQGLIDISDKYVAKGKKPWAVGGGDSWTLTDWFENVYVRSAGPDKYSDLFTGKLPFTDPSVVDALKQMTSIVANDKYVAGGKEGALSTKFVDGIGRVFGKNADAELYMEGGFVGGIALKDVNKDLKPGQDIAFFPFPTIGQSNANTVVGGGDLMVAFVDNPEVREFMKYIISKEAGEIWAKTGAIVSPNKQVDTSAYPNELTIAEAKQVTSAEVFRFDGSDLLPGTLGEEWGTALQAVVEKPDDVENILKDFQDKAAGEFKS